MVCELVFYFNFLHSTVKTWRTRELKNQYKCSVIIIVFQENFKEQIEMLLKFLLIHNLNYLRKINLYLLQKYSWRCKPSFGDFWICVSRTY
jgi:hypothetical protein